MKFCNIPAIFCKRVDLKALFKYFEEETDELSLCAALKIVGNLRNYNEDIYKGLQDLGLLHKIKSLEITDPIIMKDSFYATKDEDFLVKYLGCDDLSYQKVAFETGLQLMLSKEKLRKETQIAIYECHLSRNFKSLDEKFERAFATFNFIKKEYSHSKIGTFDYKNNKMDEYFERIWETSDYFRTNFGYDRFWSEIIFYGKTEFTCKRIDCDNCDYTEYVY